MLFRKGDKEDSRGIIISRYIIIRTFIYELLGSVLNGRFRKQIIFRFIDRWLYALLLD
jgi:hypothetical protein